MEKKPINIQPFGKTQMPPIPRVVSEKVVIYEWEVSDGTPLIDFFAQAAETPNHKLCFWIESGKENVGAAMFVPSDWSFDQAQEYYDNLQKTLS